MSKQTTTMKIAASQVRVPATMSDKFAWLKAVLRDDRLKASTVRVATSLFTFHNEVTGQCNPGQAVLARATAMRRQAVNTAVGELVEAGWITKTRTRGTACYVLNVGSAAGFDPYEMSAENDNATTPDVSAAGQRDVRSAGQRDVRHSGQRDVCATGHRTTQMNPPKGTTELNRGLGEGEIPADERTVAVAAPITANSPDMPETAIGALVGEVTEVAGLLIPAAVMTEWRDAYTELGRNLMAEVRRLAIWAMSKIEPAQRLAKIDGLLAKKNAEARAARIKAEAEAKAQVEAALRPSRSRFQIPADWKERSAHATGAKTLPNFQ